MPLDEEERPESGAIGDSAKLAARRARISASAGSGVAASSASMACGLAIFKYCARPAFASLAQRRFDRTFWMLFHK